MSKHVLLIHGWSAKKSSMKHVADFLSHNNYAVTDLHLGGYPSLFDDVRVEDSAQRMDQVVEGLIASGKLQSRFHVIVHSTGALVAREWIADRFEKGKKRLVDNFLMLAPANHGSPLANLGRSALGRIVKFGGFKRGFQSGEEMLHALEHGSEYQETLDLRDRISKNGATESPYSENTIRPYVIVGAQPMNATTILSENGWDGTVRIAAANFDPRGVTVDFTQDIKNPKITRWSSRGVKDTAFAVLPDRSHSSIIKPTPEESVSLDADTRNQLGEMILEALSVKSASGYAKVRSKWAGICVETRKLAQNTDIAKDLREKILQSGDRIPERYNEHYQIVVNAIDETPRSVDDYFVWLNAPTAKERARGMRFTSRVSSKEIKAHTSVLKNVHSNEKSPHRKVLHLDRMELFKKDGLLGSTNKQDAIFMTGITAIAAESKISFFHKNAKNGSGYIPLRAAGETDYDNENRFLKRYVTHYVEVLIPRIADDDVFNVSSHS